MADRPEQACSVLIVGAGALGTYLAAKLQSGGHAVSLVARGRRLEELARTGVRLEGGEAAGAVALGGIAVLPESGPLPKPDFALMCTKTCDLGSACAVLARTDLQAAAIVTVQNGVDAPAAVAARFPANAVIAARVHGFFEMHDGLVRHVGVAPSLAFGLAAGPQDGAAARLRALLAGSGIAAAVTADVTATLWEKFLLASSFGGVCAATGMDAGGIRADADAWQLLADALREVEALARLRGVALAAGAAERTLEFIRSFPADATTSMARDLAAGRPSEYDDLTGAVVRMARQAGMAAPAFARIEATIRAVAEIQLPS